MKLKSKKLERAWIYCRSSTSGDLEVQRLATEAYLCRHYNMGLHDAVEVLEVDAAPGTRTTRGLSCLLTAAKQGDIKHLVVTSPTRLGRDFQSANGIVQEFRRHGVIVHVAAFGGPIPTPINLKNLGR